MAQSAIRKDFFISYNHRDGAWAEWIAWELEKCGYTIGIQAWDFGAGSNFVVEMDTALRDAQRVIAVLSPNYLESNFAASEWAAPFSNDPKGKGRKLIPVRVEEVDVGGLLGQIVYIDLVGKDEKAAKAELLGKLRENRGKPKQKPRFPASKPASFPGNESSTRPQKSVKFEMVLSGTIEEANKSRVEAIVRHLQNLLDDPNLTLQEVRAGSIVLELRCSQAAFDRLILLRTGGHLNEVGGFLVEDIRRLGRESADKMLHGEDDLYDLLIALSHEETLSRLLMELRDKDRFVRKCAVEELAQMGPAAESAVPALISLLHDTDEEVRASAANLLCGLGKTRESAVPALITLLQFKDALVRASAANVLGELGTARESAVPALITLLQFRESAVQALITLLQFKDAEVRASAANVLASIGPAAESAIGALISLLEDQDAEVREQATYALCSIGPAAVPALIRLLQVKDAEVREQVTFALCRIGPAAIRVLSRLLWDEDVRVRLEAKYALDRIRQAAESAADATSSLPHDENTSDPERADEALKFINGRASPDAHPRWPTPGSKPS